MAANPKLALCTSAGLHIDSGTRRFDSKALVALRHVLNLSKGSKLIELGFNAIADNAYSSGLAERQQHARGMRGALNGVALPPVLPSQHATSWGGAVAAAPARARHHCSDVDRSSWVEGALRQPRSTSKPRPTIHRTTGWQCGKHMGKQARR